MLRLVGLVDQWRAIEAELPPAWADARLRLTVANPADAERAAAFLGPANPGRHGNVISVFCARGGRGASPALVRRLLQRLDGEWIDAELELVAAAHAPPAVAAARATLVDAWDAEVGALPADWSDLYAEVTLTSTDYLDRAALLLAPVNPARYGGETGFRFRCARSFGYGASAGMTRRCLERLDEEGIKGRVRILRALSDTRPVYTQGPVWYVGGKSV